MTTISDLEVALRAVLPAPLHPHIPNLTQVLEDAIAGNTPTITDPALLPLIEALQETHLDLPRGSIRLGSITAEGMPIQCGSLGRGSRPMGDTLVCFGLYQGEAQAAPLPRWSSLASHRLTSTTGFKSRERM
ncbi:MAG: hypothetical protein HC884_16205 [Chloroflexaceae bacterium]|nr:hypothetical protein [Chloroflexaceae bacterium]